MPEHPTHPSAASAGGADCDRAARDLSAAFPRDLDAAALGALEQHAVECSACAAVLAEAHEQQRILRGWTAPASTSRLTDRIVAAATIDAAQRAVCARKRDALEHALRDERVDPQVVDLRAHVQSCGECASEWARDHAADVLLRSWAAPSAPAHFAEALLARLRAAGVARRLSPRRMLPFVAAAIALVAIGLWLQHGAKSPESETRSDLLRFAGASVDVESALDRFGGDVHVVNVMNAQFPAGIGSFAPTAVALERTPKQPGALFHRALRKVRRDANSGDVPGDKR